MWAPYLAEKPPKSPCRRPPNTHTPQQRGHKAPRGRTAAHPRPPQPHRRRCRDRGRADRSPAGSGRRRPFRLKMAAAGQLPNRRRLLAAIFRGVRRGGGRGEQPPPGVNFLPGPPAAAPSAGSGRGATPAGGSALGPGSSFPPAGCGVERHRAAPARTRPGPRARRRYSPSRPPAGPARARAAAGARRREARARVPPRGGAAPARTGAVSQGRPRLFRASPPGLPPPPPSLALPFVSYSNRCLVNQAP